MGHGMLGTVGAGAMTGIDVALWDIKGKALGVPVWNLLGGKMRDRIPIYSHANTAEAALAVKSHGIRTIKCGGVADPVRKVATLREAVGDEVDIAIDLHGPPWLTPADAARLARALEPYNLLWIEDPIAPDNLDGYRRIRDAAHVPLAAGERMATIFGERELIEHDLVDVIQPDTGRAGGLTQMRKIAAMAEAHHIMMAPHSGSLGPVAEYAALHLLAAIPNGLILERLDADWPGRARTVVPHPRAGGRLDRRARRAGPRLRHRRGLRRALSQRAQRRHTRVRPAPTRRAPTRSTSMSRRGSGGRPTSTGAEAAAWPPGPDQTLQRDTSRSSVSRSAGSRAGRPGRRTAPAGKPSRPSASLTTVTLAPLP